MVGISTRRRCRRADGNSRAAALQLVLIAVLVRAAMTLLSLMSGYGDDALHPAAGSEGINVWRITYAYAHMLT